MPEHTYSGASIHLPENTTLVRRLRAVSFSLGLTVFITSLIVTVGWAFGVSDFKKLWVEKNDISVYYSVILLLCSLPLFLEDLLEKAKLSKRLIAMLFLTCSVLICTIAIGSLVWGFNGGATIFMGGGVLFFGMSYFIAKTKLLHRFHTAQLLAFVAAIFYTTIMLSLVYRTFTGISNPHFFHLAPSLTVAFTILGNAILLHWPNRGFVGMFTTSTTSSALSLRILLISVASVPALGLVGLLWGQSQSYYPYEIVTVVTVLLMVFLAIFAWINVKALYGFEMEHFLMKEALRVNNISLTLDKEDSSAKITGLEKTKKQYEDKLSNQSSLSDIVERSG